MAAPPPKRRPPPVDIRLRSADGWSIRFATTSSLPHQAIRWSYSLRNRSRWSNDTERQERQAQRARDCLLEIGLPESALPRIAEATVLQVSIPYDNEQQAWEARVFPWEYVLAATAQRSGGGRAPLVVRHLDRKRLKPRSWEAPHGLLFVESAPGGLRSDYTFASERTSIETTLGPGAGVVTVLPDPTLHELAATVRSLRPSIIHFAGFDAQQAVKLLPELRATRAADGVRDGLLLRAGNGEPRLIDAHDAARAFVGLEPGGGSSGRVRPRLLVANVFHSAARTAALSVAEGIGAAVGFQDTIDDASAELFLIDFYEAWRTGSWDLLAAFSLAFDNLRRHPGGTHGSGLVLWSEQPLLQERSAEVLSEHKSSLRSELESAPEHLPSDDELIANLTVEPSPQQRLNYSLLHNDASNLFDSFVVRNRLPWWKPRIDIETTLYVGSDSFPYQASVEVTDRVIDLKDRIKVPLTSSLIRSVQEPIRTSLYVDVSWKGHPIHRDTYRVTLLPVDEWVDDDANRLWLPSFVLPRDPAVARVIDAAQNHLMTLADDRSRGFDGYQSVAMTGDGEDCSGVDQQAWAIWAALVHDFGLRYINPPPTYTETGQRLRIPSQVIAEGRGTCIDLALLFASCLELVDIFPVVILLEGHAFPGYWRSETFYYDRVLSATLPQSELEDSVGGDAATVSAGAATGGGAVNRDSWVLPRESYREIVYWVFEEEQLMPIETVGITDHGSFWTAADQGAENLQSVADFHSLIDVKLARERFVTPLPIVAGNRHA